LSERAAQLHATDWQGVFYLTGGGSPIIAELLSTPGASNTVLEINVPYAPQALEDLLGQAPAQAASAATARLLGMAAFERAQSLGGATCFGLGCTASLATSREKKGTHRAHWVIQTGTTTFSFDATFSGDRESEEAALLALLWESLHHCLFGTPWSNRPDVEFEHHPAPDEWYALVDAEPHAWCSEPHNGKLLLPGSFNPIHAGHREMLNVAEQMTGLPGAYELCVKNADKPSLDYLTIAERVMQFDTHPVWLTNLSTYEEKARRFPGTTFALGVDTLSRVTDLRFYKERQSLLDAAMDAFVDLDTRFVVFGRFDGRRFVTLDDLALPNQLRPLCTAVPESTYRNDTSSTAIRAGA
jgi:hypothetical protein